MLGLLNLAWSMEHPWAHWLRFRKNQFWGPCEYHVLVIKGHILAIFRKGGNGMDPAMWNMAWNIPGHNVTIQEESILRTMWWPCIGHKGPYLGHFWERGLQDRPINMKFDMEHPWAQSLRFKKNQFEGPIEDHVLALKVPCFGYI